MEGGHKDVLELLLRAGADPDCAQRITGRRPLYMAALGGMYKIIRILIESGADKDARINLGRGRSGNFTALHAAGDGPGETHGGKVRTLQRRLGKRAPCTKKT